MTEETKTPVVQEPQDIKDGDGEKAKAGIVDSRMNPNGFPNMPNMNMPFNNPMEYNQMMQYMSANGMMGNSSAMMGS